ncbi:hypothetical protein [Singulisphaera sp. PoT]|uniref:hypothetical protein n=1 Tax=Singulisphaera sp. PoT TaxID=3411797 RepID=UPI003BF5C993
MGGQVAEKKKPTKPAPPTGNHVIFMTSRREFGGEIRMVPLPRFKRCRTTRMAHRAARFETQAEAEKFLRVIEKLPRWCYTPGTIDEEPTKREGRVTA